MGESVCNTDCKQIGGRAVRKVYVITYSNANTDLYDREKFSTIVIEGFAAVTQGGLVNQWACCMEQHENGAYHFHMCVLLSKLHWWIKVKKYISDKYGIVLHFSGHGGYHTAYQYVTKEDRGFITSTNHPENIGTPRTTSTTKEKTSQPSKKSKNIKRISNLDVSNMIVKNKHRSRVDLLAFAKSSFSKGDTGLYEFILNRGDKKVNDLLNLVWEMETAKEKQERAQLTRLEMLRGQLNNLCVCNGE